MVHRAVPVKFVPQDNMKNPWKTVKENLIHHSPFGFDFYNNDVITPAGKAGKFIVLAGRDFTATVAITTDKKIILVRQWRYIMNRECLEIPAGMSNEGENILDSAKRELLEETGAISDNWREISTYWVANGVTRIRGHIFFAKNAAFTGQKHLDDTEKNTVETYTYPELKKMIDKNIINDDRSLIGLLLAEKYL